MRDKFVEIDTITLVNVSEIAYIEPIVGKTSQTPIGLYITLKTGKKISSPNLSKYNVIKELLDCI